MTKGYFVTGTDTGVGKTWCSLALMAALQQQGQQVLGMKPVASGCEQHTDGLRNEDALLLQAQASRTLAYQQVNPYAYAPAIAPHLAAQQVGQSIDLAHLAEVFHGLSAQADWVIVEGAGGWRVPLNAKQDMSDLARLLRLPVVLVVGLRLGCINHALLSAEAIRASACELAGWIANPLSEYMDQQQENIASIAARIDAPLLATMPYQKRLDTAALAAELDLAES